MPTFRYRIRPLRRFLAETPTRRLLVLEALVRLYWAKASLKVVEFNRLARKMGVFTKPNDPRVAATNPPDPKHAAVIADVAWAVTRAARWSPVETVCLPQAMAAQAMLRRRGVPSVMHFGAASGMAKMATHAWLSSSSAEVTGYPVTQFTEIGCFVPNR